MGISKHLTEFAGRPVQQFEPGQPLTTPGEFAWKIGFTYDDEGKDDFSELLESLLSTKGSDDIAALVVGSWGANVGDGTTSAAAVAALAAAAPRLPALRALFFGDITYEESEISWLEHEDMTGLLVAFPRLEEFRVRGSGGLAFSDLRHEHLRVLALEGSGLQQSVVESISKSRLPALEHLELWIGTEYYGADVTPEHLAPILSGELFPKLRRLGLRNAENADEIAAALAKSAIIGRVRELDLSLGNLSDVGAQALLECPTLRCHLPLHLVPPAAAEDEPTSNAPQLSRPVDETKLTGYEPTLPHKFGYLEKLDISHHYVSEELVAKLRPCVGELNASDRQVLREFRGDSQRYNAHSE